MSLNIQQRGPIDASIASAITRAALFAARRHVSQRRKGSLDEPYFKHLAEVADLLAQAVGDSDVNLVVAGFLHDTIEDVGVTKEELAIEFSEDVAALVVGVSDNKTLPKADRKQLQIDNAALLPPRIQNLALADKISNLRSLLSSPPLGWSLERQKEYLLWAKSVVGGMFALEPVLKLHFDEVVSNLSRSFGLT